MDLGNFRGHLCTGLVLCTDLQYLLLGNCALVRALVCALNSHFSQEESTSSKLSRSSWSSGSICIVGTICQASKKCISGRISARIGTALCQCCNIGEKGSVSSLAVVYHPRHMPITIIRQCINAAVLLNVADHDCPWQAASAMAQRILLPAAQQLQ